MPPTPAKKPADKKAHGRALEVLERSRTDAIRLADEVGPARARAVLERAAADLAARIRRADLIGAGPESFTATQLRATLAQVQHVLRTIVLSGMREAILETASQAAKQGAEDTAEYLTKADRAYRGLGDTPLTLPETRMFDRAAQGARSSILNRLGGDPQHPASPGILSRYGDNVVRAFEDELQVGILTGKTQKEMRDAITNRSPFLQGKPAFWADRIVRTETHGARGRAQLESAHEAQEELGDVVKILSSHFDDRTGADSIAIHGQIRRVAQAFESWFGSFDHPPDRPNDRAVMIIHRQAWPIPDQLRARPWAEVTTRWRAEGRKGKPPERPLMTTVPIELFGKSATKPKPPKEEPKEEPEPQPKPVEKKPILASSSEEPERPTHLAPKRERLEDFKHLRHSLEDPAHRAAVEDAINRADMGPLFEWAPLVLDQKSALAHPTVGKGDAAGLYYRQHSKIELSEAAITQEAKTYAAYRPGFARVGPDADLVTDGASEADVRKVVFVHEASHHMHLNLTKPMDGNTKDLVSIAYSSRVEPATKKTNAKLRKGKWVASKYAMDNEREWFAETHTAYVFHPEELRKNDPTAYSLMEHARKERGMATWPTPKDQE